MTPGTVVLVPFPFTDLSGTKRRPALVVSPHGFHPEDVVLCAVTSQVPESLPPSHSEEECRVLNRVRARRTAGAGTHARTFLDLQGERRSENASAHFR